VQLSGDIPAEKIAAEICDIAVNKGVLTARVIVSLLIAMLLPPVLMITAGRARPHSLVALGAGSNGVALCRFDARARYRMAHRSAILSAVRPVAVVASGASDRSSAH
jgi:hypothetical protein